MGILRRSRITTMAASAILGSVCLAASDTIPLSTFSAGYGVSSGEGIVLHAMVGEPIVGEMSGDSTRLVAGFLAMPLVRAAIVNDTPSITSAAAATATEDVAFRYVATATDPDNATISITYFGAPSWLSVSGDTISGTPVEGTRDTSFNIVASDGSVADTLAVTLTVTAVNDPPAITSGAEILALQNTPFTYTAAATDPDNTPTLSFVGLPQWASVGGSTVTGTAPLNASDTAFLLVASDTQLADTLRVSIRVVTQNRAPEVTSAYRDSATEEVGYSYRATAADPDNTVPNITFVLLPTWLKAAGDSVYGTPPEGSRDTSFVVVASDGNLSDSLIVFVTVVSINNPPVVTSADSVVATEDIPFLYVATVRDPDNTPTIFLENVPRWLSVSGDSISGIPYDGAPDTSLTIIATDGTSNDTLVVKIQVTAVNDPPKITSETVVQVPVATQLRYKATATDPEGDSVTISFGKLPSWITSKGDSLTGSPVLGTPDTSFVIIATDGAKAESLLVRVVVRASNTPPQITSPDYVEGIEDKYFVYRTVVFDPDSTPLSYKYPTALPSWMTAREDSAFGLPTVGSATPEGFKVVASDGLAADTQTVLVYIRAVNDKPRITSKPDTAAQANAAFRYQVGAVDEESKVLTYTLAVKRHGMIIDTRSGLFSWTPADSQVGGAQVMIVVTDDSLAADTQSFAITVHLDNTAGCRLDSLAAWQRDSVKISYTLKDNDKDPLSFTPFYMYSVRKGWIRMTEFVGDTARLDSSKYNGKLVWLTRREMGDSAWDSVKVKLIPKDEYEGYSAESNWFKLDNTPAITFVKRSPEGIVRVQDGRTATIMIGSRTPFDTSTLDSLSVAAVGKMSGSIAVIRTLKDSTLTLTLATLPLAGDSIRVTLSGAVKDRYGKTIDGNGNGRFEGAGVDDYTWTFRTALLGDFDRDNKVGFNDLSYAARSWYNSAKGMISADSISEIGPATGSVPNLALSVDSLFDYRDLSVFMRMWHWSSSPGAAAKVAGPLAKRLDLSEWDSPPLAQGGRLWPHEEASPFVGSRRQRLDAVAEGTVRNPRIRLDLTVGTVENLVACRYRVYFDPSRVAFAGAQTPMLGTPDDEVLAIRSTYTGAADIQMVRFSSRSRAVSGSGTVATVFLDARSPDEAIAVEYELINSTHQVIESGLLKTRADAGAGEQEPIEPLAIVPNPCGVSSRMAPLEMKDRPEALRWVASDGEGVVLQFGIAAPLDKQGYVDRAGRLEAALSIYDRYGNLVNATGKTDLMPEWPLNAPTRTVTIYWNGRDSRGMKVSQGPYRAVVSWRSSDGRGGKYRGMIGVAR